MKYITVLDFEIGRVFHYEIEMYQDGSKPPLQDEDYAKLIVEQGHSLSNIEWMSHNNGRIIKQIIEL